MTRRPPSKDAGRASRNTDAAGIERVDLGDDGRVPGLTELVEVERRRFTAGPGGLVGGRFRPCRGRFGRSLDGGRLDAWCRGALWVCRRDGVRARFQTLDALEQGLARKVVLGLGHLHQRELERQAGIAALAHVLHGHGQEIHEPQHLRRAELTRLGPQALAGVLRDGNRVWHLAHVLHQQEVAQMLQQVGDETTHVLTLVGELLHEGEQARGVTVDHEVEQPKERVVVDCAEQLEDRGDRDIAAGRRRELVEGRHAVAEAAPGAPGDEGQGGVGRLDTLAVRDEAKDARQLTEPRPLETKRLAARADGRQHLGQVGRAEDEDEVRQGAPR